MDTQSRLAKALMHAVAAGVFFFLLQRYGFAQDMRNSITFSAALALAAGMLSWSQTGRR